MKSPHPTSYPLLLLTTLLGFAGVGCRESDEAALSVTAAASSPPLPVRQAVADAPEAPAEGGWLARVTGFQKLLDSRSVRIAAAEAAARQAESDAGAMRVLLDHQRDATHEARRGQSFWRVASSILSALAIVAIFLGAAIGSYARQHRASGGAASSNEPQPTDADDCATLA